MTPLRARSCVLLAVPLLACGTDVSSPADALLTCVYRDGTPFAAGEVVQLATADDQTLCVRPDGRDSGIFVYIPFFGAPGPGDGAVVVLELDLETSTFPARRSAAASPPAPTENPILFRDHAPDTSFHGWLRHREIADLTPRIRGRGSREAPLSHGDSDLGPSGARVTAAAVPVVGDHLELNVSISCTRADRRIGRVVHVSEQAVLVADTANHAELPPAVYDSLGTAYDDLIHPVVTTHFGAPEDIDGNGRVILFFSRAVNQLTSAGAEAVTIGFFWSGDLFPAESTERLEACPAANQAEIVYLIAPDPRGLDGRAITAEQIADLAVPLIGHELQHLVNASRRLLVNEAVAFEEPWLNEGLSHIAEELLFYEATGLSSRANLSAADLDAVPEGIRAFNRYMAGNLTNFRRYLSQPEAASLMGIDGLSTRGATWSFLRYAADRTDRGDEAFFFDLVNGRTSGLDNLDRVLRVDDPLRWMQDWTVSVYADDHVPAIAPRFTQPSWDLRSIYARTRLGEYPLALVPLGSDEPVRVELRAGGAVYTTFPAPAAQPTLLHANHGGSAPRAAVRGSLLRVR